MAIFTNADYARGITLRSRASKQPIPLDGWALEMVVKASRAAAGPLATLSTANGKLVIDPAKPGRICIAMAAADVNAIGPGDRSFTIYRTDGGRRTRLLSGRMAIRDSV